MKNKMSWVKKEIQHKEEAKTRYSNTTSSFQENIYHYFSFGNFYWDLKRNKVPFIGKEILKPIIIYFKKKNAFRFRMYHSSFALHVNIKKIYGPWHIVFQKHPKKRKKKGENDKNIPISLFSNKFRKDRGTRWMVYFVIRIVNLRTYV